MVEAGSTLTSSFFNLNLIDELWLYLAPCFLGAQSQPMLKNFELENLMQAHGRWKFSESFQYANACFLGKDLRIVLSHL